MVEYLSSRYVFWHKFWLWWCVGQNHLTTTVALMDEPVTASTEGFNMVSLGSGVYATC